MSGIKKLNTANPGALRSVQCSDLQDIWDGLAETVALDTASDFQGTPSDIPVRIISGVYISQNGFLTSGVVAYGGELFYLAGENLIEPGETLYGHRKAGPNRQLSDGTVQPFYIDNIIDATSTNGFRIGQFSVANINKWRMPIIPDKQITTDMLDDGSVTTKKLAPASVTIGQLADGAVTEDAIADGAVVTNKIAPNSITDQVIENMSISGIKLRLGTVNQAQLGTNSVSTPKIVNGAVTSEKIAPDSIGASKLIDEFPNVKSQMTYTFGSDVLYGWTMQSGVLNYLSFGRQATVTLKRPDGEGVYVGYLNNLGTNSISVNMPGNVGAKTVDLPGGKTAKISVINTSGEQGDTVYEMIILDGFSIEQS